ncbi:MAG TPA: hypothetical protein VJH65_00395 [Candidatus Nanoarchaeia archaeon]|nr:hypothetical protein [Candidatus Nanoarchaeia archaeon]
MTSKIAIRSYTREANKKEKPIFPTKEEVLEHKRLLIFDTETSADEFQNLKFGSFRIIDDGKEILNAIFYSPENVLGNEESILKRYCKENNLYLFTTKNFIEKVFYPELIEAQALCVGFNLPFDLSRLGIHFGEGRYAHRGRFSIQIYENKFNPRIKIRHINSTMSFIEFGRNGNNTFKGYFLDLKTLSSIFSDDKHISLRKAGEFFECKTLKGESEEHGKITPKYIQYNLRDVQATYEVYLKILEHLKMYGINAPITKIYSSAGLGKYALRQMGIQPLSRINTKINAKVKGHLMSGYFGGRCEVKIRKTPIEVSVLDFTSMYPSLTIIMGLWEFIIAKDIQEEDVTEEIIKFLQRLELKDLNNKELWKNFNVLVELEPDNDILPVRSDYLENARVFNVGVNYIEYKNSLFYALPDVIASVLLSGKMPKIKRATRFIPIGKQDTLQKTNILGFEIDPRKDNFIKLLIEKRQEFKKQRDKFLKDSADYKKFEGIQGAVKIVANTTTYGIFIELITKENSSDIMVYSKDEFFAKQKAEEEGKFFNPLIAVMQVAGARLLMAMCEKYLQERNSIHAYMDTDACYVPSNFAFELRDFFKPLNPYSFEADFFKIEKERLLFYGISSKRYVLYKLQEKNIIVVDYKLHGLGHLLNPYNNVVEWQKQIWEDILKLHYRFVTQQEIIEKYSNFYALTKLSVSTPTIYKRFEAFNKNKPLKEQIKPFNFFLVGQGNKNEIKPMASYSKNSQEAVFKPFIDYKSGKVFSGLEYWKNLVDVFFEFLNHPESKFVNGSNNGRLERRYLKDGEITVIGKETKNIEEQSLEVERVTEYKSEDDKIKKILSINIKEAKQKKVSKSTLWEMKERLKKDSKNFNWKTKAVKKLLNQ